jgi:hypothetical protein
LVVSDPVVDVVAAAEKLRADDRLVTLPVMLLGDVQTLLEVVTTLEAVAVRRLREAWRVDATSELCGRSVKRWLVEEQLVAGARSGRLMRLLHELPGYPMTEAAFDAAEISTDHAAAIVTALRSVPAGVRGELEPLLVGLAREHPPEEIGGFVDQLLSSLGYDKTSDVRRERRHAERGVDLASTMHGTRVLSGTLSPEVGEVLEAALALAGQPSGPEDDRTARQRRHDALGTIAGAYLAGQGAPSFTGAPRTVIVTMDLATLEQQLAGQWVTLPSGATISAQTARRLACDAELIPVVLGRRGEVLDIGQADHEFTAPIRRAAWLRDRGRCAFPRCGNRIVELHHLVFRRHRGPTSLDNAAWLCAYHHWLAHEGGWTLRRQTDGSYLWTNPHGSQRVRHPHRE